MDWFWHRLVNVLLHAATTMPITTMACCSPCCTGAKMPGLISRAPAKPASGTPAACWPRWAGHA